MLILSTKVDQKYSETEFLIGICGDKMGMENTVSIEF